MDTNSLTLGDRIAALRRGKGIKQDELAETLGVSPQAVSKWENNISCPDIMLLPKLAEIFEVTSDELLTGKKEPPAKLIEQQRDIEDIVLRMEIVSNGAKIKLNLPAVMLQSALDIGMSMPQLTNHVDADVLSNIDFVKLLEMARRGVVGNLVEIETDDGTTIRIFVE